MPVRIICDTRESERLSPLYVLSFCVYPYDIIDGLSFFCGFLSRVASSVCRVLFEIGRVVIGVSSTGVGQKQSMSKKYNQK